MEIRLIAPGEEEACNEFHNRLYGHHRSRDQWQWEFRNPMYGAQSIPYALVKDGDKVVGTQAFIPIQMIDRNGVYWTAKSEETLVDPDYRGQQLFEKMYQLLFRYAEEHSFAYIWGFTPAVKAFTRLGFSIPGTTQQLFIPFSSRSVVAMRNKQEAASGERSGNRLNAAVLSVGSAAARIVSAARMAASSHQLPPGLSMRTMEQPDPQAGDLCKRFIEQWGGTTIFRDSAYLRWRFFENPYVKSIVRGIYDNDQLLGWVAYTLGDDGLGYVVDILVSCDEKQHKASDLTRALLIAAVTGARNMGATGIRGWRVNGHPFDRVVCRAARQIGFYHIKRGHPVVLYTCPAGRDRAGNARFDDWYITRAFTEGVSG